MMNDLDLLIDKLRNPWNYRIGDIDQIRNVMAEAADNIERLRAGLTKIKDGVNEPCGWAMDDLQDYCVELLTSA